MKVTLSDGAKKIISVIAVLCIGVVSYPAWLYVRDHSKESLVHFAAYAIGLVLAWVVLWWGWRDTSQ